MLKFLDLTTNNEFDIELGISVIPVYAKDPQEVDYPGLVVKNTDDAFALTAEAIGELKRGRHFGVYDPVTGEYWLSRVAEVQA